MSRPRVTPEMALDAAKDAFRLEVKLQRVRREMTQGEVADMAGIDKSRFSFLLANLDKFYVGQLRAVIRVLGIDPATILRLLGFSDKEIRRFREDAKNFIKEENHEPV